MKPALRVLTLLLSSSATALAACSAHPADDTGGTGDESALISDTASIVQRPDGNFDVTCRATGGEPARHEIVTGADILANNICKPIPNDPFDPASCPGSAALDPPSRFAPGRSITDLGRYQVVIQQRSCTAMTGCDAWKPASKSQGPSGKGMAKLFVKSATEVGLSLVDDDASSAYGTPLVDLGQKCSIHGADVDCSGGSASSSYVITNTIQGAWFLQVGSAEPFHGTDIGIMKGQIRPACFRIATDPVRVPATASSPSYTEYRTGILARF